MPEPFGPNENTAGPPAGIPALPPPSAAVDLRQDQGRRLPLRVAPMEVILEAGPVGPVGGSQGRWSFRAHDSMIRPALYSF